jgi:type VI protein secretion system component Hcp
MVLRPSKEQTMRDQSRIEEVPSLELTAENLEKVSGGVSMSYSTIKWEYTKQDDTGAAKGTNGR